MSASELARRWNISLAHAYRMLERGDLPSVRFGATVRTPIAAVEAYEQQGAA
ncbi:MAG: helix-turn-helix domain-containing protein [Candidatus Cybelea sp.]|jgi:excisionase family DNA binding protein